MTLPEHCEEIARRLAERNLRVVFAESCTAGLLSATLARVPGISEFHCGSAVTYRNKTKQQWLAVPAALLDDPGPVSEVVARSMALGVLEKTPEAQLAVSVTGHLGPNAPPEFDGLVYFGTARRDGATVSLVAVQHCRLVAPDRESRQQEAVQHALRALRGLLEE